MKKFSLLLTAFCIAIACSAQLKTYSANDCNQDGQVNISDVNSVISKICGDGNSVRVVPVDSICALLRTINADIAKQVEKELGISDDPVPDPTIVTTHEYVDLGLPSGTLWATCNVGATSPEEYGDYFAWGETTGYNSGKTNFSWSTYKWYNGSYDTLTKYCTDSSYGTVDNKTELESADDAATANWGSNWQMPSFDQIDELCYSSYTTTTCTTQNGVNGILITSKTNGNTIFLPAAGCRDYASLDCAGADGYYRSRSLDSDYSGGAYYLYFYSSNIVWSSCHRYYGFSVRPVRVQN